MKTWLFLPFLVAFSSFADSADGKTRVTTFPPLAGPCHCGLEESCSPFNLTMDQLEGNKTILLPTNITLTQVDVYDEEDHRVYTYDNTSGSLTLTVFKDSEMYGTLNWKTDLYTIRTCEKQPMLVKHKDRSSEIYPTAVDFKDNTTMVRFSLMFHYTPEFRAAYGGNTQLIKRRLQSVVSAMNAVYRRNSLPLAAFIHCLAESPIHDMDLDKDDRMEVFVSSDSLDNLLGSADVGVLVTSRKVGVCGKSHDIGGLNSRPLVIVADSPDCLDQWSLDHEIGHLLGARHNPEAHQREPKKYGYGKLLQPGEAGGDKGFGTIMAYTSNNRGFPVRIPYYSRPDAIFNRTGEPLGDANSNNAALIMGNRRRLAAIGDESRACTWPDGTAKAEKLSTEPAEEAVTSSVTAAPAGSRSTGPEQGEAGGQEGCADSSYHHYDCLVVRESLSRHPGLCSANSWLAIICPKSCGTC